MKKSEKCRNPVVKGEMGGVVGGDDYLQIGVLGEFAGGEPVADDEQSLSLDATSIVLQLQQLETRVLHRDYNTNGHRRQTIRPDCISSEE